MYTPTDSDLLLRLATRQTDAVADFYQTYRSLVLGTARSIVGDEWYAEEVLQDVVMIAHTHAPNLPADTNFRAWVRQVSRNSALMLLRRLKRVPIPVESAAIDAWGELGADSAPRPDSLAMNRQTLEKVDRMMRDYEQQERDLLLTAMVDSSAKDEVAHSLGISVPALKSRMHRLRLSLRTAELDSVA